MAAARVWQRKGYVLLMTLLMVAVAGAALSVVSRSSLQRASRAIDAAQSLQQKWGALTCQAAILSRAGALLEEAEKQAEQPVPKRRIAFQLADQDFEVVIADEQAKLNINSIHPYPSDGWRTKIQRVVGRMLRETGGLLTVRLTPTIQLSGLGRRDQAGLAVLGSFAQVFPGVRPGSLLGAVGEATGTGGVVDHVTCWGNGRLNFRRASGLALAQVQSDGLGADEVESLIKVREENPGIGLDAAMQQMEVSTQEREAITQVLTDRSWCQSMWIISRVGDRVWHRFAVREQEQEQGAEQDEEQDQQAVIHQFTW